MREPESCQTVSAQLTTKIPNNPNKPFLLHQRQECELMWGGRHREGQDSKIPVHILTEMCNISLPASAAPLCQGAFSKYCTAVPGQTKRDIIPRMIPSLLE